MREIKFRARRIDNGEWVYGNLVSTHYLPDNIDEAWIVTSFAGNTISNGETIIENTVGIIESFAVHYDSVGQYTGRKDKNGKEIYEGDIIQWLSPFSELIIRGVVTFQYGEFTLNHILLPTEHSVMRGAKNKEVIGNIHEHPELLEESYG